MVLVKPLGPHQFTICSGFVHTSQTSSTGASNFLDTKSSRSLVLLLTLSISFCFKFLNIIFQRIKFLLPVFPVAVYPYGYLSQPIQLRLTNAVTSNLSDDEQAAAT